ncbi:uncharacterized protein LOC124281967 [Haliotis rubra]|uniref:uncharacterized protein LOC124281967 n=1 Tax=Haliotis rubra TaxID=36100 RepID=UPI001EE6163D|nr:uncharacterized protein LOC124281967 [Haliotis rubra]
MADKTRDNVSNRVLSSANETNVSSDLLGSSQEQTSVMRKRTASAELASSQSKKHKSLSMSSQKKTSASKSSSKSSSSTRPVHQTSFNEDIEEAEIFDDPLILLPEVTLVSKVSQQQLSARSTSSAASSAQQMIRDCPSASTSPACREYRSRTRDSSRDEHSRKEDPRKDSPLEHTRRDSRRHSSSDKDEESDGMDREWSRFSISIQGTE